MATSPNPTRHRGFTLDIDHDRGTVTATLTETNGHPDNHRRVATLPACRYDKAADVIAEALTTSGIKPAAINNQSRDPIDLEEPAGVRLALALAVIAGIRKPGRARALIDGINRFSNEECLYWYAAALSGTTPAPRRLRALRLYLADD